MLTGIRECPGVILDWIQGKTKRDRHRIPYILPHFWVARSRRSLEHRNENLSSQATPERRLTAGKVPK